MTEPSKFTSRVWDRVLQRSDFCLYVLLLNAKVALMELPGSTKFGFAVISWVLMTASGALCVASGHVNMVCSSAVAR